MLAHKLRDDEKLRLLDNIDSILTGENKKYKEEIVKKCEEFHEQNKHLLNENDFSLNIEGFSFKSENEIKYENLLTEFIYKELKILKGQDK